MQDLGRLFFPAGRAALGALFFNSGINKIAGFDSVAGAARRLALALCLIPVTLLFHAFCGAGAAGFQDQQTHFLKNAAIFGGMLLVIEREGVRAAARPAAGIA